MDRNIPVAWNLFSVDGGGHDRRAREARAPVQHVKWPQRHQDLLMRWCDRSSSCERPRTYDRFYAKTPGNFHPTPSPAACPTERPRSRPVSLCSSDGDFESPMTAVTSPSQRKVKRRSKARRELRYSRTLTERDVKHLDRHLSMKKTIRKKIMRDLQQAFVDDPDGLQSRAAAEPVDLNALNFDPVHHSSEQRFLDLLRDSSDDSGFGGSPKTKSKSGRNKGTAKEEERRGPPASHCGDYNASFQDNVDTIVSNRLEALHVADPRYDDQTRKKRSFWQFLTGKKKASVKRT